MKGKPVQKKPVVKPLPPDQEQFCIEYIRLRHGERAAINAGYSPKTARVQASQLLTRLNIRYRIRDLLDEQFKRLKLSADYVLTELHKLSSVDIRDAYDEEGNLKPVHELPEHIAKAVASIETEELFDGQGKDKEHIGTAKKIKFYDKKGVLELLGKHYKLYVDVLEHRGVENLAEQIKKARQRREQAECKNSPKKKK